MKISLYNSTLSCISKCIRISLIVINKKLIFGLLIFSFLSACTAPTAMLGPAYTLSSSGNVLQAGLSYGSNQLVTSYTGKTPMENFQAVIKDNNEKQKNIMAKTLKSEDFHILVKNKIIKTNRLLKLSNQ